MQTRSQSHSSLTQAATPATYDAFSNGIKVTDGTNQRRAYGVTVSDEIAASAPLWQLAPDQLAAQVTAIYTTRWPDQTPPTTADVSLFCQDVTMSTQYGVMAGIAELGYAVVTDAPTA